MTGTATPSSAANTTSVGWSTPRYTRAAASPSTTTAIAHLATYLGPPGTTRAYAAATRTAVNAATGTEGAA